MKIAVLANDRQWEEINRGAAAAQYTRIHSAEMMPADWDALLWLKEEKKMDFEISNQPVFLNAVTSTLQELNAPQNVVRINGWNSFLARSTWEISGTVNDAVKQVGEAIGRKIIQVPDEPGFISARVVAMIINEAYFALEDNISTPKEIDIAMKLGTSYPYGPLEWAAIIGEEKVFQLLEKLSEQDKRYLPATLLKAVVNA